MIFGVMYIDNDVLKRAQEEISRLFGDIDAKSENYDMDEVTKYYREEMGDDITKFLLAVNNEPIPGSLPDIKTKAMELEERFSRKEKGKKRRRINLDPGFLTPSSFVLSTSKNYAHRIHIGKKVFAELTLMYKGNEFISLPWTYPDYETDPVQKFLKKQRQIMLKNS